MRRYGLFLLIVFLAASVFAAPANIESAATSGRSKVAYNSPSAAACGNDIREEGEDCDGEFWCDSNCTIDCTQLMAGDVNASQAVGADDIIYLVNMCLKGGPNAIPCYAFGNVNCSGAVTSADIIYMVTHVFKGGPAPCDPCEAQTSGSWICPPPL